MYGMVNQAIKTIVYETAWADTNTVTVLKGFVTSPVELIKSLDNLHPRLQLTFDELKPFSFGYCGFDEGFVMNFCTKTNGHIELETKVGEGSTFMVFFPTVI